MWPASLDAGWHLSEGDLHDDAAVASMWPASLDAGWGADCALIRAINSRFNVAGISRCRMVSKALVKKAADAALQCGRHLSMPDGRVTDVFGPTSMRELQCGRHLSMPDGLPSPAASRTNLVSFNVAGTSRCRMGVPAEQG